MKKKILIVEDQFVEANDLQLILQRAGYNVCGIARSVPIALEMLEKEKPDFILLDIFLKGKLTGIDLAHQLKKENIAFIYLSANSNEEVLSEAKKTEPYGFIVKPFREKDLLVTLEIAEYRHEHSRESKYKRETELLQQLEKVHYVSDHNGKLSHMAKILQQEIPFDYLAIGFDDSESIENWATSFLRIAFDEYQVIRINELSRITGSAPNELVKIVSQEKNGGGPAILDKESFEEQALRPGLTRLVSHKYDLESMLFYPLRLEQGKTISCRFYSRRPDTYNNEHFALLDRLQQAIAKIVNEANRRITGEKKNTSAIPENSPANTGFNGIVGNSHLLLNVFDQINQVAPFDTAVLILGESGTGKESIADAIHHLSPRKKKPFVKINCAALPPTLIESELFGHEKGSFTGANDKKTGKFELANGGTIFLDEIGEMPIDLQVKLLRVLQEKEVEPIGARSPIKIDVRIVAATNKNLEKEVGEGRFRLDLYYRLNVFPVQLPPLRERIEDIPALTDHFIAVYNRKSGKKITGVSEKALRNMIAYSWPGNIRELENLVERNVLLSRGTVIEDISFPSMQATTTGVAHLQDKSIHENERDYIISILKKCNGKIWGTGGAAEVLKLPPSTLKSKMKKLGIQKGYIS